MRLPLLIIVLFILITVTYSCAGFEDIPYMETEESDLFIRWTQPPFTWEAVIKNFRENLKVYPGENWSFDFDLDLDLEAYKKRYGKFTEIVVVAAAERRFDKEGWLRTGGSTFAVSSNFTTTGLAVERFDAWPMFRLIQGKDGSPFEGMTRFSLRDKNIDAGHSFSGSITVKTPPDIPEGYYEPRLFVMVQVEGAEHPVHLSLFGYAWDEWWPPVFPLVKVGNPDSPKMPWTILANHLFAGRAGMLPSQYTNHLQLVGRSGFNSDMLLPPGDYDIAPGFPDIFPQGNMSPVDGGFEIIPPEVGHFLEFETGWAECKVKLPDGTEVDLGKKQFVEEGEYGPELSSGPFSLDMSKTGIYDITLTGQIGDSFGRTFTGGGTYRVTIANPLTFSTSCKPGTSFLVGNGYPAKVNVNPPFPAEVTVDVEYYPNSDPSRKIEWTASGIANRFGHYVPLGQKPIIFTEPGEYKSTVNARYLDSRGVLWRGQQTSSGVIAPHEREIELHGSKFYPYNNRMDEKAYGATREYENRSTITMSFLPDTPYMLMDPYAPYSPNSTLFVPANGAEENIIEPHLSVDVKDPVLYEKLLNAHSRRTVMPSAWYQPVTKPWNYMKNVIRVSTDSFGIYPADQGHQDDLPVFPIGEGGWHPTAFPEKKIVDGYIYMGIVRPGFPAMTTIFQSEAAGLYWNVNSNRFGHHFNAGVNGDLPGDVYRIQAGVVIKDHQTGKNYYDAYGASIAVHSADGELNSHSVLGPGKRPLAKVAGREHLIFLATDTHDTLEVGEIIGVGGMVFPNIPADLQWTIDTPSGETHIIKGRANRLGLVRGKSGVKAEEPGIYRIKAEVAYKGLKGDIVGTADGTYWHAVVTHEDAKILRIMMPPVETVDTLKGVRIPLSWPEDLKNAVLHYAVIMPGQVFTQGRYIGRENSWEFPFIPLEEAVQFPNIDVRNYFTGDWEMVDTFVFQFFLEGERDGQKVHDSERLVLRRNKLYNYKALLNPEGVTHHHGGSH